MDNPTDDTNPDGTECTAVIKSLPNFQTLQLLLDIKLLPDYLSKKPEKTGIQLSKGQKTANSGAYE